jgi:hypothetical protein
MSPWIKEIPKEYFASYVKFPIWVKPMDFFPNLSGTGTFPKVGEKTLQKTEFIFVHDVTSYPCHTIDMVRTARQTERQI